MRGNECTLPLVPFYAHQVVCVCVSVYELQSISNSTAASSVGGACTLYPFPKARCVCARRAVVVAERKFYDYYPERHHTGVG